MFMKVNEVELPSWFQNGRHVDVLERSPDAEYVLEPDEFDLDWRECQVPLRAFEQLHHENFNGYIASMELYRIDPVRSTEKVHATQAWMAERGPERALHEAPPLVLLENGQLDLVDGWHRIGLAHYVYGLKTITALVAVPDRPNSD